MMKNHQSSLVRCCWGSGMLLSWQCHVPNREFYRPSLCSLLCCCSSGSPLFYTGASTTLTCPRQLIPLLCTITTGVYVTYCIRKMYAVVAMYSLSLSHSFFVCRTDCESPASFLCSYPVANISLMRNKKHVCMYEYMHLYIQMLYAWYLSLCVKCTSIHRNYPRSMTFNKCIFRCWHSARHIGSLCSWRCLNPQPIRV